MRISYISAHESQLAARDLGQIVEPAVIVARIAKRVSAAKVRPAAGKHVRRMRADYPRGGIIPIRRSRHDPLLYNNHASNCGSVSLGDVDRPRAMRNQQVSRVKWFEAAGHAVQFVVLRLRVRCRLDVHRKVWRMSDIVQQILHNDCGHDTVHRTRGPETPGLFRVSGVLSRQRASRAQPHPFVPRGTDANRALGERARPALPVAGAIP
jgi:hypothetical protein